MATPFDDLHLNALRAGAPRSLDLLRNTAVALRILDQIDGRFVVETTARVIADMRTFSTMSLGADHGLQIQITQGAALVEKDPYNGQILITPKGTVPVRARPILSLPGGTVITGGDQEVGIDIAAVPQPQQSFDRSGGGDCRSRFMMMDHTFDLEVRAFMPANVIPLALDRREIRWRHALYFAYDPMVGLMRISNNPAHVSRTTMRSKRTVEEPGQEFFPAEGRNELYFILEMLDLGYVCFNKDPMVQPFAHTDWPPFSTVMSIDRPLSFFDVDNPDREMLRIERNDMRIYDYSSVDVECLEQSISEDGTLRSRWRFTNQTDDVVRARWFALGNFRRPAMTGDQGNRLLGAHGTETGSFEAQFVAQVEKSSLPQFITMNLVSVTGPIVMGSKRLNFTYPSAEGGTAPRQ